MDSAKADLADKLKNANNILVTVSRDPSVDQLAACIGLTLLLNKMGKHAAAIFSGQVPSTIEFLQPEETLEKNTDSLRDFIIALDKSKADKLRYKVEDNVVRIFITPYRTSINQDDLEFSQGDFNVDVVVALGVRQQEDLDNAITVHGRILHDAVVASLNITSEGGLGSISWHDAQASSLSELVTELAQAIGGDLLDSQIATALLTGIVAATDRFSNDKTSSQTMNASAKLMAAGANQQLVASKLENAPPPRQTPDDKSGAGAFPSTTDEASARPDGTLEIRHDQNDAPTTPEPPAFMTRSNQGTGDIPEFEELTFAPISPAKPTDESGAMLELPTPQLQPLGSPPTAMPPANDHPTPTGGLMTEAPSMGGTLTANSQPESFDPVTDPLSLGNRTTEHLLDHMTPASSPPLPNQTLPPPLIPEPVPTPQPQVTAPSPPVTPVTAPPPPPEPAAFSPAGQGDQTLFDIEQSVNSPHLHSPDLGSARDEVNRALVNDNLTHPEPIQALGAQPLGSPLHTGPLLDFNDQPGAGPGNPAGPVSPTSVASSAMGPAPMADPDVPSGSPAPAMPGSQVFDPMAPPPVPPPIPFQFGAPPGPPAADGPMMPL